MRVCGVDCLPCHLRKRLPSPVPVPQHTSIQTRVKRTRYTCPRVHLARNNELYSQATTTVQRPLMDDDYGYDTDMMDPAVVDDEVRGGGHDDDGDAAQRRVLRGLRTQIVQAGLLKPFLQAS